MKTVKLLLTLSLLLALSQCVSVTKRKLSSASMTAGEELPEGWDYNDECEYWYYYFSPTDTRTEILIEDGNDISKAWACSSTGPEVYDIDGSIYSGY